jgi:hypothetical protein
MPLTMGEWGEPETHGLLMSGNFGEAASQLPEYDLSQVNDPALLMALFRDYTCMCFDFLSGNKPIQVAAL